MSNGLKKPEGAWAVFQAGYNNRVVGGTNSGSKSQDAKTFFNCMSKTIISEYEQQGFCEFVDDAIDQRAQMDLIVFAAICHAKRYLGAEELIDSEKYVPYIGIPEGIKGSLRPTWDYYNKVPMNRYFADSNSTRSMLLELRNAGRKAHLALIKKTESVCQNTPAPIDENAKKKTGMIVEDANVKAEPDATIQMAEKYLAEGRIAAKKELDIELADMLTKRDTQISMMERFHDEMRDATDSIHALWSQELTNTVNSLSNMKEELYDHIHKWQISLYPYEFGPLAQRYIELYRIINVDKLLDQEVLFAYSKKNNHNKDLPQKGGLNENSSNQVNDVRLEDMEKTTIDGLQKLNKSLTIFVKKFEASLNGLGMYVYYPKENEQFDDVWHILENGDDGTGSVIKRCIVPGIAKKRSDGDDDDVIIPAIVEV